MEQYPVDVPQLAGRVIQLRPKLGGNEGAFREFCRLLSRLLNLADGSSRHHAIGEAREEIESLGNGTSDLALRFACSVVTDMVAQGWELSASKSGIELTSPKVTGISPSEIKQRIREGHLLERDAQLREPSVRDFVKGMEQRHLWRDRWVSIFSLMRNGEELAQELAGAASAEGVRGLEHLRSAIKPYLQLVDSRGICEFTGIKLTDIWRYFRHTWVSSYKSVPGRSMMILVRDAAAPFHPVIGIASLGSSMAQQTQRDEWIGWESESFVAQLAKKPTKRMSRWVNESVQRLIDQIYLSDFVSEGVIKRPEIKTPTDEVITRLQQIAEKAAEQHRRFPDAANHKSRTSSEVAKVDWWAQAGTPLFRSKRARALALILGIRANLQKAGMTEQSAECLSKALESSAGRSAIRQLVRLVKAEHVGIDMMDIVICGAIAPYNLLLGGKLVCLLLVSPEVIHFYRERYREQASIIASSMKGKAVFRPPNLVLLATTSLYGIGSSQYNRIRVPLKEIGGRSEFQIEYAELGISRGYGSYHFSQASIDYLETLLGRAGDGRKVNSIFGEGVNPLIRKLRDGLSIVGLPTDELLKHGNPRLVYGVPLAENFREVLLGINAKPKYFFPLKGVEEYTEKLADYWRRRWLSARISRQGILEGVAQNTLSYPIAHGARVQLPKDEMDQ